MIGKEMNEVHWERGYWLFLEGRVYIVLMSAPLSEKARGRIVVPKAILSRVLDPYHYFVRMMRDVKAFIKRESQISCELVTP